VTTIRKGYKFKLDATPAQQQQFRQYCGAARWVWNHMLAERSDTYKATGKSPTAYDQIKTLPILKRAEATAWLADVHSQVLQNAVLDLQEGYNRFFSRQNGYPKFRKKHGRKQSFSYPQSVRVVDDQAFLPKIGWVKFRRGKPTQKRYRVLESTIKRATISHKASGWYIAFNCEVESDLPKAVPVTAENSVGIDLGSIDLVTPSDGVKVVNPRLYRRAEKKLRRAQRRLSKCVKGSANYGKQKRKVARLHEGIANKRLDTLHQLSAQLLRENQAVFCESLNVKGIAKRMGKSAHDAGWAELVRQLEYKAARAGKTVIRIDRWFPSSKLCSCCGYKHSALTLSERSWQCPSCETVHDRDWNAAVNIKHEGLRLLAAGHAES